MSYKPLLWSVLLVLGCGDDAGLVGPPTEVSIGAFCDRMAEASCRRVASCGYDSAGFDSTTCEAFQRDVVCAPFIRAVARAEQAGELSWLAVAAQRCVDTLGGSNCETGVVVDLLGVPECQAALAPLASDGESCTMAISCVEGTFCNASATCPGACQALARVNENCSPSTPCEAGTFCALAAMRCLPQSDLGAVCETLAQGPSCREGSFCDGSQPGDARCVAGRGRNGGCQSNAECAAGLSCIANRCSGGETGDSCGSDLDCRGSRRCGQGRCQVPSADGQACSGPDICAYGLGCAMTCQVGVASGESCDESTACAGGGRCVQDQCVPRRADGESCSLADECLDGRLCIDGVCRAVGAFCPV